MNKIMCFQECVYICGVDVCMCLGIFFYLTKQCLLLLVETLMHTWPCRAGIYVFVWWSCCFLKSSTEKHWHSLTQHLSETSTTFLMFTWNYLLIYLKHAELCFTVIRPCIGAKMPMGHLNQRLETNFCPISPQKVTFLGAGTCYGWMYCM